MSIKEKIINPKLDSLNIEQILKDLKEIEINQTADAILLDIMLSKYKENTDLAIVAMKISVIDYSNSLNLLRFKSKITLLDLAKIIIDIPDFDQRVSRGDLNLVNEIARKTKEKHQINLFSFASKYCCFHNVVVYGGDDYSIFDRIVCENLPSYYNNLTANYIYNLKEKFDYIQYCNLISSLLVASNIDGKITKFQLDQYLWNKHK